METSAPWRPFLNGFIKLTVTFSEVFLTKIIIYLPCHNTEFCYSSCCFYCCTFDELWHVYVMLTRAHNTLPFGRSFCNDLTKLASVHVCLCMCSQLFESKLHEECMAEIERKRERERERERDSRMLRYVLYEFCFSRVEIYECRLVYMPLLACTLTQLEVNIQGGWEMEGGMEIEGERNGERTVGLS